MKYARQISVLAGLLAVTAAGLAHAQPEQPKWFVLRKDTIGACRAALLVQMNGEYAHFGSQLAGGPYDTRQQALDREKELLRNSTCTTAS